MCTQHKMYKEDMTGTVSVAPMSGTHRRALYKTCASPVAGTPFLFVCFFVPASNWYPLSLFFFLSFCVPLPCFQSQTVEEDSYLFLRTIVMYGPLLKLFFLKSCIQTYAHTLTQAA